MRYRSREVSIVGLLNDGVPHVSIADDNDHLRIYVLAVPELEDPTTPEFWEAVQRMHQRDAKDLEALLRPASGWTLEQVLVLAEQLDLLQAPMNQGRGVTCVKGIIAFLRRGDLLHARVVAENEGHKLRDANGGAYEDIRQVVGRELFRGVEKLSTYYEDVRA